MSQMQEFVIDRSRYDDANQERASFSAAPGVTEDLVKEISRQKNEPGWMLQKRLEGYRNFIQTPMPTWGPDLSALDLDKIRYFVRPDTKESTSWEEVPEDIRKTFERIGIPEAERRSLSGAGAQYDSDVVYHNLQKIWEEKGVIFENMDVAVQKYPELVKKFFMTSCVPVNDHKFVMLHAAVWSGGTFIYVPPGVKVEMPLQAYFRMNAERGGQFEHTLIIADQGAEVQYIEGCSAPRFDSKALHAGCVELFVMEGARIRYSSVENWSRNTYNLNTKRAIVEKHGIVEWVNGNMGCLTGDTKIFTNPKGPVSIKSIEPGDKVFAWDEKTNTLKASTVRRKIYSGEKKVYRLRSAGREIMASANHPFLSLTRKKHDQRHKKAFFYHEWRPLDQLKPGDIIGIVKKVPFEGKPYQLPRIHVQKTIQSRNQYAKFTMGSSHLYNQKIIIPDKTSEDFMWVMGILLGDGHVDVRQNKINIATHEREDYRELLCSTIRKLFHYDITEKKERYLIINSKALCALFTQSGFGGNADTKQVPAWVFTLPKSQILAFLAGYIDSDGHVAANALALTSVNKDVLYAIQELGIYVGFGVSKIFKHRRAGPTNILGNPCNALDSWRLLFNGKNVTEMPLRCLAKREMAQKIKTKRNYVSSKGLNFTSKSNDQVGFARIDSIEYIGVQPTFDIEVEGYHNFIANGMILHNSGTTMLYPCSVLKGEYARSDSLGIAFAGPGQNQDTGSKVIHLAPNTTSTIKAKSISKAGGISTYRGYVKITKNAVNSRSSVVCDALLIDGQSVSNTYPFMKIYTNKVDLAHEATVGRIGEEQIFYLMSRGLTQEQAMQMIVSGFIEPIVKALPLEYAIELNKLIELEMEGTVG